MPDNPYAATDSESSTVQHTPRTVWGTLSRAQDILGERFVAICTIVIGVWVPLELASSYYSYHIATEETETVPLLLDQIFEMLAGTFVSGVIIHLSYATLMRTPLSLGQAMFNALKTWPLLIANRILLGIVLTIGFVLFLIPGLYLMVRLTLVEVVTVIEKQAGTASISRSYELTGQHLSYALLMCCFFFVSALLYVVAVMIPITVYPEIDTWYLDALTSTAYDMLSAFFQICAVIMFVDMRAAPVKPVPIQLRVPMQ